MLTILFFGIYDPIPILLSKVDLQSDPFTLLRKGSTIRYFQILFDPFRSFSILSDPILIMYT